MGISRDKWHKRRATGGKRAPIRMKRKFELGRQPAMTRLGERRVHQVRCRGGFLKFRALKVDHGNYAWPGEAVTRRTRIVAVVYNPTNPEYVRTNTIVKGTIVQIDATPFKNWYQKHYGVVIGKATAFVKANKKAAVKKSRKYVAEPIEKPKKEAVKKVEEKKGDKKGAKKADTKDKKGDKVVVEKKEEAKPKKAAKPTTATTTTTTPVAKPVVKKVVRHGKKPVPKPVGEVKKSERKCKATNNSRKGGLAHKPSGAMLKKWRLRNATRVLESSLSEQFEKGRLYAKISTSPGQIGTADGYVLEGEELAFYVKKMQLKKKK